VFLRDVRALFLAHYEHIAVKLLGETREDLVRERLVGEAGDEAARRTEYRRPGQLWEEMVSNLFEIFVRQHPAILKVTNKNDAFDQDMCQ
jgi:hypothetical protein